MRKLVVPMLWILSAGNPAKPKRELEFRPMQNEQAGVYTLATAWRTRLVVISELADDRQTLLLRLMGRGKTREAAARQLITTYAGTWEAMLLLRPMERLRLTFTQNPTQFTRNERREIEALMDVLERAEQIRDELRREGHIAGMVVGKLEGKLEKARTLGITVIDEDELKRLTAIS